MDIARTLVTKLCRQSAYFEADGVLRLRPWVPTNHGREVRYGDPSVTMPIFPGPVTRRPDGIPAFIRAPIRVIPFLPMGDC